MKWSLLGPKRIRKLRTASLLLTISCFLDFYNGFFNGGDIFFVTFFIFQCVLIILLLKEVINFDEPTVRVIDELVHLGIGFASCIFGSLDVFEGIVLIVNVKLGRLDPKHSRGTYTELVDGSITIVVGVILTALGGVCITLGIILLTPAE